MRFGKRDKSIIDALFLLALFGVFLICALFIVLFGAKIYKNTVKNSDTSFNYRTSLSYVSEKIRQNDNIHGIDISGDVNSPVVMLSQTINNRTFCTYLYENNGYLCEYTTNEGNVLNKDFGAKILEISSFNIEKKSSSLYKFTIIDINDVKTEFFISIYSDVDERKSDLDLSEGGNNEN